ncbi:probable protein phosphatase 2C 27 [Tanacetum coccineum]
MRCLSFGCSLSTASSFTLQNRSPSAGVTIIVVTSGSAFVSASKASLFTAFGAASSSSVAGVAGLTTLATVSLQSYRSTTVLEHGLILDIDLSCMEDTHICIPDLARSLNSKLIGDDSFPFYGVFDGHGGEVVTRSFMETDDAFTRSCALESDISSGTIALSAMIFGRSVTRVLHPASYYVGQVDGPAGKKEKAEPEPTFEILTNPARIQEVTELGCGGGAVKE